jgi:hypothetical protein
MTREMFFQLLGPVLLVAAIAAGVATAARVNRNAAVVITIAAAVIALIPIFPTSLAGIVLGTFDMLSTTTLVLQIVMIARTFGLSLVPLSQKDWRLAFLAIAAAEVVLIPSAMGVLPFDAYAAGFGGALLPALLLLLLGVCYLQNSVLAPALIAAALLSWHLTLGESANLWDYLVDPIALVLVALALWQNGRAREVGARNGRNLPISPSHQQ